MALPNSSTHPVPGQVHQASVLARIPSEACEPSHPPGQATGLDPPETNVQSPINPPSELYEEDVQHSCTTSPRSDLDCVTFRHSGWAPVRNRIWRALQDAGVSDSRLEAFETCGHNAWVMESVNEPGTYRIASDKCHDRLCSPCGAERSRVIAANVIEKLAGQDARFITLTLRGRSEPLRDTITRLYKSFARLRSRKLWKRAVTGGVAFLEIKRSADCNFWHVHLHALVQGKFLEKRKLSGTWHTITGDSYVVDIAFVRDQANAARYVAKYASKPIDPTATRDHEALIEVIHALKGRRLCLTFGSWRGYVLTELPDQEPWQAIEPLSSLLQRASAGAPDAVQILNSLKECNRCQRPRPPPTKCTPGDPPGQLPFDWTDTPSVPDVLPF